MFIRYEVHGDGTQHEWIVDDLLDTAYRETWAFKDQELGDRVRRDLLKARNDLKRTCRLIGKIPTP